MAAAVLVQGLQSLMRYASKVWVGYFAARCRANITALIHRQVLSLSYPCASQYKVGELTVFSSAATSAVQQQIEIFSDLAVSLLMALVYLLVLLRISPWLLLAVGVGNGDHCHPKNLRRVACRCSASDGSRLLLAPCG